MLSTPLDNELQTIFLYKTSDLMGLHAKIKVNKFKINLSSFSAVMTALLIHLLNWIYRYTFIYSEMKSLKINKRSVMF